MHFGRVGGADCVPFTNSFPEPPLLLHIPQERSESFSDFVTEAQKKDKYYLTALLILALG